MFLTATLHCPVYKITGASKDHLIILESGSKRGVLFGDSSYAWHVTSSIGLTNILSSVKLSDESDYNFAVSALLELLPRTREFPQTGRVYRKKYGRANVYYVEDDKAQSLFILMLCF